MCTYILHTHANGNGSPPFCTPPFFFLHPSTNLARTYTRSRICVHAVQNMGGEHNHILDRDALICEYVGCWHTQQYHQQQRQQKWRSSALHNEISPHVHIYTTHTPRTCKHNGSTPILHPSFLPSLLSLPISHALTHDHTYVCMLYRTWGVSITTFWTETP